MIFYLNIFIIIFYFLLLFFFIWLGKKNYEIIYLSLSLNGKVTLYGLNQRKHKPFCSRQNDGTEWFLSKTQKEIGPGNFLLEFRRKKI